MLLSKMVISLRQCIYIQLKEAIFTSKIKSIYNGSDRSYIDDAVSKRNFSDKEFHCFLDNIKHQLSGMKE